MALFLSRAGVKMTHVPYKGVAPAIADLVGGHVPMVFGSVSEVLRYYKGGTLRVLGVSSDRRLAQMPEVPTVAEQGFPGYRVITWNGLVAPAGVPQDLVMRYNADVVRVVTEPAIRERLSSSGFDPIGDTPVQFSAYLKTEFQRWATVIRVRGIKAI